MAKPRYANIVPENMSTNAPASVSAALGRFYKELDYILKSELAQAAIKSIKNRVVPPGLKSIPLVF